MLWTKMETCLRPESKKAFSNSKKEKMLSGFRIYYKHKMNAYCTLLSTNIFPLLFKLLKNIGGFRNLISDNGFISNPNCILSSLSQNLLLFCSGQDPVMLEGAMKCLLPLAVCPVIRWGGGLKYLNMWCKFWNIVIWHSSDASLFKLTIIRTSYTDNCKIDHNYCCMLSIDLGLHSLTEYTYVM